jgi:ADP-ribose pyrophosphatase YjhB (NUDIX family)
MPLRLGAYYALPGGGQHTGETLPEALTARVARGDRHSVKPVRMAGVYEQITAGRDSGSDHKMYFIFLCEETRDKRVRHRAGCLPGGQRVDDHRRSGKVPAVPARGAGQTSGA